MQEQLSWQTGFYAPGRGGEPLHPELWSPGPVGLWVPALGQTGARLLDVSGRGYNGTNANVTWSANTAVYDGTSSYTSASDTAFQFASKFSIVVDQVAGAGVAQYDVIASCVTGGGVGWRLWTRDAASPKYYFEAYDTGMRNTKSLAAIASSPGVVIATHDGSYLRLYVNGVFQTSAACGNISYVDGTNVVKFYIGCMALNSDGSGQQRFWPMNLRTLGIYPWVLTAQQIALLSADPLAPLRLAPSRRVFAITLGGGTDYPVSLSIDRTLSAVEAALGSALPLTSLSRTGSIAPVATAESSDAISVAASLAVVEAAIANGIGNTSVGRVSTVVPISVSNSSTSISAPRTGSVSPGSTASSSDAVSPGRTAQVSANGSVASSDSIGIERTSQVQAYGSVSALVSVSLPTTVSEDGSAGQPSEGEITIALSRNIIVDGQVNSVPRVTLSVSQALDIVAQMLAEAGVTQATIRSVAVTSSVIYAEITTPIERIYAVAARSRTLVVKSGGRTLVVAAENRTLDA